MNWNISAWCIRNPILPIVLFLLLSFAGILGLNSLGIELQPNVDKPGVYIRVNQHGAAAAEIESQITKKVEDAISGVANVKHITSSVNTGTSLTNVVFNFGTNSDRALSDIREAMRKVRGILPRGIEEPEVDRAYQDNDGGIVYVVSSKIRDASELGSLLDNTIARSFMSQPSVGQAIRFGGVTRQICIDLEPAKLDAYGVTADFINSQVQATNLNLPGGNGSLGGSSESIRVLGSVSSVEELKRMRIPVPGKKWVELGQLGRVYDGSSEPKSMFFANAKPSIGLDLLRRSGKNVVELEKDAERVVAELEIKYPDLSFSRIFDSATYVKESCSATFEAMFLGAALAVFVIFLFLRSWRAALIAGLAMPLSVIPTFAFMQMANYTLNDMSLLGLALVIGILVDDAIVEIENIVRHINRGKHPYIASIDAADEIGLAVVATTMAVVVVFLPVAFMGGSSGLYFRQFGMTVAVSVFFSLVVARMLTPLLAAYWLKPVKESAVQTGFLQHFYEFVLAIALRHRYLTVIAGILFFAASAGLFQALPKSYLSRVDNGKCYIDFELPAGALLKDTVEATIAINNRVLARPEVDYTIAEAGTDEQSRGGMTVTLKPRSERKLSLDQFENALRGSIVGMPGVRVWFGGGGESGRADIMLTSLDSDLLEKTAQELIPQIRSVPEFTDIHSTEQAMQPELNIQPLSARAAEQGVTVESIARTAMIATVGNTDQDSAKFEVSDHQIPIIVRLSPKYREKASVIANLKVMGSDGRLVPLSSVAKLKLDSGILSIDRFDRARRVKISAKFGDNISLSQALARIRQLPAYKSMPSSVSERPIGYAEEQGDLFGGFGYAIATGVVLIFAVLALLFRSFFQPLTIMISLPLSLGGALLGLWGAGKPIDMYALIGIVMLMGLVTKNAILLVEYCLVQMGHGVPRKEAIFLAARTRMRPIMMTTMAMIAGMTPIAVGFGAGAEIRSPMAIAVVAGLVLSTILTLVVVPVVLTFMDDLQKVLARFLPQGMPLGEHGSPLPINNLENAVSQEKVQQGQAVARLPE